MIKKIDNVDDAIKLIKYVYLKTEAKNDTIEGQNEFLNNYTKNNTDQNFYGYYKDDLLVGVASINKQGYIKYLFIDPNYNHQQIGSSLLKYIIDKVNVDSYTLDSSVYSYEFYIKMGFVKTSDKIISNGMSYIPMKYTRRK